MADPFREKRVVRRNKAVFQKSCRDPSPARQGGINPALSLIRSLLDGFTTILSLD